MATVSDMTLHLLTVQNWAGRGPGLLADWLSAEGIDLDVIEAYAGERLPERVDADGLLVLGGPPAPRDDDVAPWLPSVRALLTAAVHDEVPTLGICLGHQLLAIAGGGDAGPTRGDVEVGLYEVAVDRAAAPSDALFGALPDVVFAVEAHQDEVWELPPGAVALASTSGCSVQAYRLGSCAWGVQFHPEVIAPDYAAMARRGSPLLAGRDAAKLRAECEAAAPTLVATWQPFAARFGAIVAARAPIPTVSGGLEYAVLDAPTS